MVDGPYGDAKMIAAAAKADFDALIAYVRERNQADPEATQDNSDSD